MKVLLKKEIENEVEFPVPSFWKGAYDHRMITEDHAVKVSNGLVSTTDDKARHGAMIEEIINPKYEVFQQIDEVEFLTAYNKTLTNISNVVTQFEPVY